ncbi:MAG: TlpA family protein disulfide reductase [Betaproteobacteria bacterium]|nr:TlpA family protein disulfide reductase [Betaproteobacteria bacterium]
MAASFPVSSRFPAARALWIALALLVAAAAACRAPETAGPAAGDPFPDLALERLEGGTTSPAGYRGKVVVLNVWGTWCAPCRKEMPSLQGLAAKTDRARVAVLGLATDADRNLVREFLLQYRIEFPIFLDPDRVQSTAVLRVRGFPETFIIAPDGRLLARVLGERDWEAPAVLHALEEAYRGGRPRF